MGAEVIKVESAAYPDGLRQTLPGQPMSRSWAMTHRNEASLGLDLRHPEGAELFGRLVAESDAVFANFKPGTLAALGFSYDALSALNPRIVLAESSAFGATGPWSARMGYGPLVRATTGVSRLWCSDDPADTGFYDATTIFPDHVAARITAIAALCRPDPLRDLRFRCPRAHLAGRGRGQPTGDGVRRRGGPRARADRGRRRRHPRRPPLCGRRRVVRRLRVLRDRPCRLGGRAGPR